MNKKAKKLTAMIATVFFVTLVVTISLNTEANGTTAYVATGDTPTILSQTLLFVGDFETGDLTGFYTTDNGNTPEVVSTGHPVRASSHSMRAYLHRYESGCSYRTMATVQADDEGEPELREEFEFTIGNEYWIGFSIYVQANLVSDPPGLSDIVFQVHGNPDEGEDSRNPPIALVVDTREEGGELVDYWRIWRLWDPRAMTTGGPQYDQWYEMMLPMADDIGHWTDWVFRIIFDYNNNGDGLLQVWRNGAQVLDVSGGNCFNDQLGPYPTFGVYKWPWRPDDPHETNSEWRLFYFDEFRIGDANATYEDVAPPVIPTPIPAPPRATDGLQVLYTFQEGSGTTVRDVSGVGAPLDLTVGNEAAVGWTPSGGLFINSPTSVSSAGAATKIIDACIASDEISIEAWVKPANTTQGGPARIVTLSDGSGVRNFTLAQEENTYDTRLRTTLTSDNGLPSLTAGTVTLSELSHVVYTRDDSGMAWLYVNGVEVGSHSDITGDFSNWDEGFRFGLANEFGTDRTWLGEYRLIAIYDRALSQAEVSQNFNAGPPLLPWIWLPLVLYHTDSPGASVDQPGEEEDLAHHWLSQVCSFFVSKRRD